MALHPRRLLGILRQRLSSRPITVLTGARQTGKTTIVRDLLPAAGDLPSLHFSLDDRGDGRRFLLLGSAKIPLPRQVSKALAGRATLLELWPLGLVERVEATEAPLSGLDRIW